MRLLAIDQGSNDCGVAMFEGDRVSWTKLLSPPEGWSWLQRMRWITDALRLELAERGGDQPAVVAIEDVVAHSGHPNLQGLVAMAEARGWLMCAVSYWFSGVRQIAVHPSKVKSAVGAPQSRDRAKQHIRWAVESLTGLTGLSQDECDAVCIGLAAQNEIRHQELLERAGIKPTPKPRRRRVGRPALTDPQARLFARNRGAVDVSP